MEKNFKTKKKQRETEREQEEIQDQGAIESKKRNIK